MTTGSADPLLARVLSWIGRALTDLGPALATALGALGFGISAVVDKQGQVDIPTHPTQGLVLVVSGGFTVLGVLAGAHRLHAVAKLRRNLERTTMELAKAAEALEGLARVELTTLASSLHYGSPERVSLFGSRSDCFELLARYSGNPTHQDGGRRRYSKAFGCLGSAWLKNDDFVVIDARRQADPANWEAEHEATGMPPEMARELRMSTRTVIAHRIDDPVPGRPRLGVLVVESEQTYRDIGVSGPPAAKLDPEEVFDELTRYDARFAGVLSVFSQLGEGEPAKSAGNQRYKFRLSRGRQTA